MRKLLILGLFLSVVFLYGFGFFGFADHHMRREVAWEAFNVTDGGGEVFRVTDGTGEDFNIRQ